MPANKKTRKEVSTLCDETIDFLSNLKIDDKDKSQKKKIEKIIKKANTTKDNILKSTENKHKPSGYNKFIIDFNKIKKNENTSEILNEEINNHILDYLNNNNDKNLFSIVGKYWREELDKTIKNKYNLNDEKK